MLDAFLDPEPAASYAQPKPTQPTTMIERFKRPQPMSDDAGRRATVASFTLGSSTESRRSPPTNASGTQSPNMLDAYMDSDGTPTPTQTSTPERTQTPNMLDAFTQLQPVSRPVIEVTDADGGGRDGSAAVAGGDEDRQHDSDDEVVPEEVPKKQEENKVAGFGEKMQRKKVTEEPSAMSILDNFDF